MPRIRLEPLGIGLQVSDREVLLTALQHAKVYLEATCKGEGTCSTCAVEVAEGAECLSPMRALELATLKSTRKDPERLRLSCQTCAIRDGAVFLLPAKAARKLAQILEQLKGRRAPRSIYHPKTHRLLVAQGDVITQTALEQLLGEDLSKK